MNKMNITSIVELIPSCITALDFEMLKGKLMDVEEGQGWSHDQCEFAEMEYRRFLALKLAFPDNEIVPDQMVDTFWHQHILDTQAYEKDCNTVFGRFVHHYPYFGMNGPEDAQALSNAFEETQRLYLEYFGLPMSLSVTHGRCRTQCKPVKCK